MKRKDSMIKKTSILFVLCLGGMLFAEEAPKSETVEAVPIAAAGGEGSGEGPENTVSFDLFPLIKGIIAYGDYGPFDVTAFNLSLAYERFRLRNFSIGVGLDAYFGNIIQPQGQVATSIPLTYFSITAQTRWYLLSDKFQKLFIGADLGFNSFSVDGDNDVEDGGFLGFIAALKIGYRISTPNKIYIEPAMSYVLSKTSVHSSMISISPLGWQGGLKFGYSF